MLRKFLLPILVLCLSQRAEPQDGSSLMWREPVNLETLDLGGGPGGRAGAPQPPFVFREEGKYGTNPKIIVSDSRNATWEVKWGREVKAEPFATRLLWAVGYLVESSYYVPEGQIEGAGHLANASPRHDRTTPVIDRSKGNAFSRARFELRDPRVTFDPDQHWAWDSNPFQNSNEFAGLKMMMMLVSNWDSKDSTSSTPNTSILKVKTDDGGEESHFIVNDWGGSMGRWGGVTTHTAWDCQGYKAQTPDFVKGLDKNGKVRFGYSNSRTPEVSQNITPEDVAWLMTYLGRLSDAQIRSGLIWSNADAVEVECFTDAIRSRIEQLRAVNGR
jgi:hypothetical protein